MTDILPNDVALISQEIGSMGFAVIPAFVKCLTGREYKEEDTYQPWLVVMDTLIQWMKTEKETASNAVLAKKLLCLAKNSNLPENLVISLKTLARRIYTQGMYM